MDFFQKIHTIIIHYSLFIGCYKPPPQTKEEKMRSKATVKNSIWGVAQQVIVCIMSLFSRRVMIDTIGVQGVGLNAFLNSVITMLSLAELGIGTAIVYHMYAPLARDDRAQLARLMQAYKKIYRIIACAIMLLGLALLPFMDKIVNDVEYSKGYVSLIFVLFLVQTTSSYLFTYKRSILSADQKQYVITAFDLAYRVVTVVLGIGILLATHELAYYIIMLTVCTVAENVLISKKADKLYPFINEKTEPLPQDEKKQIAKDVSNIFVGKVSGVVTNSTDSVLINAFVGTVQTGLYSNYNIIIGTLNATMRQFSDAMRGSVGNLIAVETPQHIDCVLRRILFIMYFVASFCACCLVGLIDPFVTLAFGEGLLLERFTVFVCIANLFVSALSIPVYSMVAASGLFRYDKYISVAGSGINLILSFVLGKKIGMAGILIGTFSTYAVQTVLKIILLYKKQLGLNCISIFVKCAVYFATAFVACAVTDFCTSLISLANPYVDFVLSAVVSVVVPVVFNSAVYCRTAEFAYGLGYIKNIGRKIVR